MSAIDNQPANLNFLSPLNFEFKIKKCPNINFFVQQCNVPGVANAPVPEVHNPFTKIPKPGDHIDFEDLVISFKVDELMTNWFEIWNWIRETGYPESFDEYKAIKERPKWLGEGIFSDISVMILNSNKNPMVECTLIDAFPYQLGPMQLNSVEADVNFVTATANFKYNNYKLVRLA